MFLDDTPAYPAAFFGAVRAGFVPLLISTLTPPDLLQFYLSDAGAAVAVADAEFCAALQRGGLQGHAAAHADRGQRRRRRARRCRTRSIADAVAATASPPILPEADTAPRRDGVLDVFVRLDRPPKGIVHLQHDMAYSELAFARSVLQARRRTTSASRCRKIFFAYGFGNSDHLPVLGRRGDAAAAGPAKAGGDLRGDRALSSHPSSSACRRSIRR